MRSYTPRPVVTLLLLGWLTPNAVQAVAANDKVAVPAADALEPMVGTGLVQLGLGLLLVLALIVAMGWFMRRVSGLAGSAAGALRILGGLSVGTRERVVLIQVGEQQVLLGVAPGRVQTLHVLEQAVSVTPPAAKPFADNLAAALKRGKNP